MSACILHKERQDLSCMYLAHHELEGVYYCHHYYFYYFYFYYFYYLTQAFCHHMSDGVNTGGPVCFFTFDKLCNANVGAADYIALANKFHTIALSGVPVFTADIRSQAYRCALAALCCFPTPQP